MVCILQERLDDNGGYYTHTLGIEMISIWQERQLGWVGDKGRICVSQGLSSNGRCMAEEGVWIGRRQEGD